jgi:hypothetical protein
MRRNALRRLLVSATLAPASLIAIAACSVGYTVLRWFLGAGRPRCFAARPVLPVPADVGRKNLWSWSAGYEKGVVCRARARDCRFLGTRAAARFDAEKIHAGIAVGMRQMAERGWQADLCLVQPDETASVALARRLATATYDCVVIGGGIRIPPKSLLLFEILINAVHKSAPSASIAFNTRPEDTADAAARWLKAE